MYVVIDTNILVSALWTKGGNPAEVLKLAQSRAIVPCWDYRIMKEYRDVLLRPKFNFDEWEVIDLLEQIEKEGTLVIAKPLSVPFTDESDRMFYEVAKYCGAHLITGNLKHFPDDGVALLAAEFLKIYNE
ncbi:MAG: putative toxin-antitoxin system toxin component, PIN family [Oscillospiraceae bacterium]|nr:putative toxin-antitoxin system toxin component, PIN family [Oscillospiraceae bacterium]